MALPTFCVVYFQKIKTVCFVINKNTRLTQQTCKNTRDWSRGLTKLLSMGLNSNVKDFTIS